jgi:serine/threonine protein kinase/DNA-binding winged helix-turn-helix (wHTH) protein
MRTLAVLDSHQLWALMEAGIPNRVRFGAFEFDLKAGELRKGTRKVLLQEQSFQILLMLVQRPGDVLTRDEIQRRLWPNDTVVEFDHSIHTAINKLRQALGDSADSPKYIETLARRGYRLLTPVEACIEPPADPTPAVTVVTEDSIKPVAGTAALALGGDLIGKRISHYRVLGVLGGGGMGLVYRAEDIKLGRGVALKFLPEELANDPVALERFEREARAASALDHPSICAVHEFGEHEGRAFIVMQLLEGRTLRERIDAATHQSAPFQTEELLSLATQIADGLAVAHQQGIIHRDIKPANIFITTRGVAKILDFGLAKQGSGSGLSDLEMVETAPTGAMAETTLIHLSLTRTGVALGTAAYMSPEQVRGERLDGRSDLFSFGLVLYEMAAGRRAFEGETAAVVHDALLHRPPAPLRRRNPEIPAKLEGIVSKALEKNREKRYQSAAEISADLAGLRQATPAGRKWALVAALGSSTMLLLVVILWLTNRPPLSQLDLRQQQLTTNSGENAIINSAISPDAEYLIYADRAGIYLKLLETGDTQKLPEPVAAGGSWQFAWLPDSTRFLASPDVTGRPHSIWAFSVMGGAPRKLRDDAYVLAVSPDGINVAFTTNTGRVGDREIWLMGPNGEQARKLRETDQDSDFEDLKWSPDGRRLAYIKRHQMPGHIESAVESLSLKGGAPTTIYSAELQDFHWLRDGRMVLSIFEPSAIQVSCNLWELRVDTETGKPRGQLKQLTNWAGFCMDNFSASADGKRLAFHRWSMEASVWIASLEAGDTRITAPRRFTQNEGRNFPAAWTPDSQTVLFWSDRNRRWQLFKQSLDSDTAESIFTGSEDAIQPQVSPDGAWVLYLVPPKGQATKLSQLMRIPLTGGSPQLVLTAAIYDRLRCAKSPASFCSFAERTPEGRQIVITAVDPLQGRGRELTRFETDSNAEYTWDLSPDGDRVAVLKRSEGRIRILSLKGAAQQDVTVKDWNNFQSLDWTADGKGLFLSSSMQGGTGLLHVDLRGIANLLWQQGVAATQTTGGVPSPDGRHLAMLGYQMQSSNVWMIEDF